MYLAKSDKDNHFGTDFPKVLPGLLPKIHALARQYAGDTEQDDLVQEGLIALYECSCTFDAQRGIPFDAYALTCVRRRMISALRKNSVICSVAIEELQSLPDLVSTAPAPEDYALGKESVERLRLLMHTHLSPFERQVLSLHLDGLRHREIAQRVGKTEKSVENALSRIRTKLSKQLAVV